MKTLRPITLIRIAQSVVLFCSLCPGIYGAGDKDDVIEIEGTVVARYINAMALFCQDGWDKENIIVVRIERRINGNEAHQYIRVHYPYTCGISDPLPEQIYDGKTVWRFTLTRSEKCDGPLEGKLYPNDEPAKDDIEPIPRIHRTPHAEKEQIPFDTVMHCYLLRTDGFKSLSIERSRKN